MRWDKGRDEIERMLSDGYLQRVPASREHADRLLAEAERHLASAGSLAADDPQGAFALMYDASRKALTAILANQGLRPTTMRARLATGNVKDFPMPDLVVEHWQVGH